jgi:hypothetical protein
MLYDFASNPKIRSLCMLTPRAIALKKAHSFSTGGKRVAVLDKRLHRLFDGFMALTVIGLGGYENERSVTRD